MKIQILLKTAKPFDDILDICNGEYKLNKSLCAHCRYEKGTINAVFIVKYILLNKLQKA